MDGVTAIAEILRMEGVDFIGCVPYQPLLEAAAIAGIWAIIFRQEGTGIHMVDGYSRVTNGHRIGVFMMQNGPGAENGFGGVAQAYAESVPILLLPAGMARQRRSVHPNFYPTRSYESITKWCAEINLVERVPELLRRAFAKLRSGRPGPVLLEIPQDVALSTFREEWLDYTPPPRLRPAGDPEAVEQATQALLNAQHPILHAGQGVLYAEATNELVQLAEFLQAPVMTTLPGKSAFPEHHPLAVGASGPSTTRGVHRFLMRADLVCGVGCSFTKTNFAVPTTPINPYRVVWDLLHTVDLDRVIVTHESGSAREYMVPFWEARQPRSFLGWGKSTQLGYSLGLAMGAKLAAPDKHVINVMGDMAFSTVGLDIETAVRCHMPILTIVLNNSYMSIYDNSRFPVALEKYDVKRLSGQFAEVAQAMGAYSEKITDPQEIVPALQRGLAAVEGGKATVLEFLTCDEGEYSKFA